MATIKQIQLKRSKLAGSRPTTSQIAEGELAINLTDRTLFTNDGEGNIIDLGFAKGGDIDGNVNHVGDYNLTGDLTVIGDIESTNINATNILSSDAEIISNNGRITSKAAAGNSAHVFLKGDEVDGTSRLNERGLIFANPQTAESGGFVGIRTTDKSSDPLSAAKLFKFTGTGDLEVPEVVKTKKVEALGIETTGTGEAVRIIYKESELAGIRGRYTTEDGGDIDHWFLGKGSTVNLNREIIFASNKYGTGLSLQEDQVEIYGQTLRASSGLSIGGVGALSILGNNAFAIGDSDTGMRWRSDGYYSTINNSRTTVDFTPDFTRINKRLVVSSMDDAGVNEVKPDNLTSLVQILTDKDNNGNGDGRTHIGRVDQNGNFEHIFRGQGTFFVRNVGGINSTYKIVAGSATFQTDGNIAASMWGTGGLKGYIDSNIIDKGYPVGAPIPWPSATVPSGYIAMEGQAITQAANPILYSLYGANLPDMRGQTIKGLPASGRAVLSFETDDNKAHNHSGTANSTDLGTKASVSFDHGTKTTSSFDYGSKNTNNTGAHTHSISGTAASAGAHTHAMTIYHLNTSDQRVLPGAGGPNVQGSDTYNTTSSGAHTHSISGTAASAGEHTHSVAIGAHTHTVAIGSHAHNVVLGSHTHTLTINNQGSSEVRVKNVAFKYIVRIG